MQQTSKYQFNLVEGSDDFSPTPLNQNMEKVEEALSEMNTAMNSAQETTEESTCQLWDGMISMAEHDLITLRTQADAGGTVTDAHLFYNRLDSQADAQVLNGALWSSDKHIFLGMDTRPTLEDIKAAYSVSTMGYISATYSDATAYYYFTAPGSAQFSSWSFVVMMFFSSSQNKQIDLQFEMRAEHKSGDSWTVCAQSSIISLHMEGQESKTVWTPVSLEFTAQIGEQYRMVLQLKAGHGLSGLFGFTSSDSESSLFSNNIQTTMTPISLTQGSHIRQLPTEGIHRALLLARYNTQPEQGGVSVQWNDTPLECIHRDGTDRNGQPCRELCAVVRSPFSETSTLKLDMNCGPDENLSLLDYAVYIL